MSEAKRRPAQLNFSQRNRADSEDSVATSTKAPSLKSPRTPRFAEATAVHSPIDPPRTNHYMPQPQISDIGFGYVNNKHESVEMPETDREDYYAPKSPLKSPLKSAMRIPGAPPREKEGILSPTFKESMIKTPTWKEEEMLEKRETSTDARQAQDLKVKVRVRIAKFFLRGVNFSCSLIILAMLSTCFNIFRATNSIPPRNNLPPWAQNQQIWPQILLLSMAGVSLFCAIIVFWAYWRGGHKKAQKVGIYYSAFAVMFFIFSIVMWLVGAIILHQSKANGQNKDFWGWSCVDNQRKTLFENEISYDLICRLQNWSLVCAIIEIVVEVLTIAVYAIVFHRFYSKRRLRKSMAIRDRARSDLYLAQLRAQSAPGTPAPFSPRDGGYKAPNLASYVNGPDMEENVQYVDPDHKVEPKAFQLQAPPIKVTNATPKMQQIGFTPLGSNPAPAVQRSHAPPAINTGYAQQAAPQPSIMSPSEHRQEHFGAAPGEQVYEAVAIPGAYNPVSPTNTGFAR